MTLINSMVNYLLDMKFEDEEWYEITEEAAGDQSESQTSEITKTCTVCEENCHEFDCWWVSDPSKCEIMKNSFCTVGTGRYHHSKHVKEDKRYIIRISDVMMEFDSIKKEYEKAQ
ncbi:hypothetical protein cypCar_00034023 [Cyprinus carpio]|nr:hypothetical protein cypCar_00034023 [Cyprinus carpio]